MSKKIKKIENNNGGNRAFFSKVWEYYLKEWKLTLFMLILMILVALFMIAIPLLANQMTMSIMQQNDNSRFWGLHWKQLIGVAVGIIIANAIGSYTLNYLGYLMGKKIEIDLRNRSLEALVRQDISYYSDKKIGEILTKIVSDTQIVGDWAIMIPMSIGISFFQLIGATIMMFIFEWRLALVVLSIFIFVLTSMLIVYFKTTKTYHKVREVITDINGNVTDRIATIRLIKATGTENYETERFKEIHKEYYNKSEVVGRLQSGLLTTLFGGVLLLMFSTIIVSMLLYGNKPQSEINQFFTVTFASFALAQELMIGPLFNVMNASFGLAMATVATNRINDTLYAKAILNPHYWDGEIVDDIKGDIVFKDVEFIYPEKPTKVVLPKFDFTFKEGKSYAFVGETGSGKSTIAKLILRFYDPSQGKVIINGNTDLKDVNLSSYLNYVGYVEQEPQILYGDVFENIKYGRFDATDEQVIEAAKKAELHDLIMTWPEGYKTILGERGFMLSGGQKQRLVIARMFLKDPKILILDEATSALDNIVEKEIQNKLNHLMKGRTSVSIAHRLSTIKNADEIVVLGANGQGIVQIGTFDELKTTPGHFQNLYKAGLME